MRPCPLIKDKRTFCQINNIINSKGFGVEKLSNKSTKSPVVTDYGYIVSNDGVMEGKVNLQKITVIPETSRTINLDNSMTTLEIQTEIDAIGKFIPKGVNITIQFANGTYNLDASILVTGFYGAGTLNVYGDSSQTGLRTDQSVHLNFSGEAINGILITGNILGVTRFSHCKVTVDDGYQCVMLVQNTMLYTFSNYLITTGKTSGSSIGYYIIANGSTQVFDNYLSGMFYGIISTHCSFIYSTNNDDTGTQPNYGMVASIGGVIGKAGTQPSGSTANENVQTGGAIR